MIPRNCNFCGLCCTLIVRLSRKEVERIESLGHDRKKFVETDGVGNLVIKRREGWCHFFERRDGIGRCTIYAGRPARCRDFPGKKLCDLRYNAVFRDMSNKLEKVKLLWEKAPKKTYPIPKEKPEFPLKD